MLTHVSQSLVLQQGLTPTWLIGIPLTWLGSDSIVDNFALRKAPPLPMSPLDLATPSMGFLLSQHLFYPFG